jgi:hypothetical protein
VLHRETGIALPALSGDLLQTLCIGHTKPALAGSAPSLVTPSPLSEQSSVCGGHTAAWSSTHAKLGPRKECSCVACTYLYHLGTIQWAGTRLVLLSFGHLQEGALCLRQVKGEQPGPLRHGAMAWEHHASLATYLGHLEASTLCGTSTH